MKILGEKIEFIRIRNNDEKYISSIVAIADGVSKLFWKDVPKIVHDYTDHYRIHSFKILNILNSLLKNAKNKISLTDEEIYILTISALLHDIGLQCEFKKHKALYEKIKREHSGFRLNLDLSLNQYSDKDQAMIRKYHHLISSSWIEIAYSNSLDSLHIYLKTIPAKMLDNIINVCKYHSKLSLENLPHSDNCRIELLILLFRMADELDIGKHRCNPYALNEYNIRPQNSMYWEINLRSEISISAINDISMTILLSNNDYQKHKEVADRLVSDFHEKNKHLIEKLRERNMIISFTQRQFDIQKSPEVEDLPPDVVNELYYSLFNVPYTTVNDLQTTAAGISPKEIVCYISFDNHDMSEGNIQEIDNMISHNSNKTISVKYFDKLRDKSYSHINSTIYNADCLIIISNNNYVSKIHEQSSHISCEYSAIYNRFTQLRSDEITGKTDSDERKCLFYILTDSNEYAQSRTYMSELKMHIEIFDISGFKQIAITKGNSRMYRMLPESYVRYRQFFDRLIYSIFSNVHSQSEKYKRFVKQMYTNFFLQTREQMFVLPPTCFVKTHAYHNISSNLSYIIIGRKGSGKSTVIRTLAELDSEKYKGILEILVDDIPTSNFFDEYTSINAQTYNRILGGRIDLESDVKNILGLTNTLNMVWRLFIYIYCIFIIYNEFIYGKLNPNQANIMRNLDSELHKKIPFIDDLDRETATATIYSYAKESVFEYGRILINTKLEVENTTWEIVESTIVSEFTFDKLLYNYFDISKDKIIVKGISQIVDKCSRRILITMDKFDAESETLRTEKASTSVYKKAIDFEAKWLNSFLETVYSMRENSTRTPLAGLYKILDFCLCIPHDRFSEFILWNRDAYKYNNAVVDLYWSGVELAIMLRKRLEYLYPRLRDIWKKGDLKKPEEILQFCLKSQFPQMPEEIHLHFEQVLDGKKTHIERKIPLFQYVLRMSFWRPRDILEYFAGIISYVSSYKNADNISVDDMQEMIKKDIKMHSAKVIDNEFLREYSSVIHNIREIVLQFDGCNQLLSWDELFRILDNVEFNVYGEKLSTVEQKFSVLYEIGFLGVFPTTSYREMYAILHDHAFVFNERRYLLTGLGSKEFHKCRFIIHPIFTERLKLIINVDGVLCLYDWDYLHRIENLDKREIS
jgi:energy-coupling factor transporter ATP-binding protein EcfA2